MPRARVRDVRSPILNQQSSIDVPTNSDTSRQTPAKCQRYLWSRHRQRKCRTIRSSRLNSAWHFVTGGRAHGGCVVFGFFTFCMGVIGPGNRSPERKSHRPTRRHWIGSNGAVCSTVAPRGVAPILPFRGLEVQRYPYGLAPRGRKGRWDTVPSLVRDDRSQLRWLRSPEQRASCVARLQTLERWRASALGGGWAPHWPDESVEAGATPPP